MARKAWDKPEHPPQRTRSTPVSQERIGGTGLLVESSSNGTSNPVRLNQRRSHMPGREATTPPQKKQGQTYPSDPVSFSVEADDHVPRPSLYRLVAPGAYFPIRLDMDDRANVADFGCEGAERVAGVKPVHVLIHRREISAANKDGMRDSATA